MGLVSAREVSKVLGLSRYGFIGDAIGVLLLRLTRIQAINRFYYKNKQLSASAFLDAVIAHFQIDFEIPDEDFKRLPKSGPFITVSNHPLGAIDGVLLLKIMLLYREDYKIMANFLLHRVAPMAPNIFPVNPFENHKDAQNSLKGFKDAMRHLKEGHVLGIFPAGEVSTVKEGQIMVDKAWEIPA
ncbi:MAG: 1-acyl-sn-glycerol-3-phosphate acyltransferase, partial [Flavobacteriaceae bacterium]